MFSTLLSRALKENFREEFDLLRSDGQSIPTMLSLNNFSAAGHAGISLIATDLTTRKQADGWQDCAAKNVSRNRITAGK